MKGLLTLGAAALLAAASAPLGAQTAPAGAAARPATRPATATATADAARGKAQFARCMACHSADPAKPRGIGPNLAGVVGRPAGRQPGFKYTPVLAAARFRWTPEKLDAFIAKPRDVVPGTNMVFAGINDPAARKAIIAYLATTR